MSIVCVGYIHICLLLLLYINSPIFLRREELIIILRYGVMSFGKFTTIRVKQARHKNVIYKTTKAD